MDEYESDMYLYDYLMETISFRLSYYKFLLQPTFSITGHTSFYLWPESTEFLPFRAPTCTKLSRCCLMFYNVIIYFISVYTTYSALLLDWSGAEKFVKNSNSYYILVLQKTVKPKYLLYSSTL